MSQFIFPPLTASLDSEQSDGGALPSAIMVVGGYDGSLVQVIKTDADGNLQVDVLSSTGPSNYATDTLQTAGNAILTTIDVDTGSIAGAISGSEMQVDVVAALPGGTNSIGTVILGAGTAEIGKLAAGTAAIGTVILGAGTAEIGKLAAGTASIGILGANSGVDIGDVTLNAGTAAFGKLSANSGVDIGDVDVTSIIPGVGATNLGKAIQSAQGVTDTGVPALVVRNDTLADLSGADGDYAPLQVNASGALYAILAPNSGVDIGDVDVTSSALPTGAATSALQTTANGILTTIDADTGSIAGAISGSEMQVDIVASLPVGTNEIGKLAAGTAVIGKILNNAPVDFLDSGIIDSSTANIATGGTTVVASLAADCKEIEVVDDIGEYMSMRVGGVVKAYLPLGGGAVQVSLSTGNAVQLYSETGTAIASGSIAINFLG